MEASRAWLYFDQYHLVFNVMRLKSDYQFLDGTGSEFFFLSFFLFFSFLFFCFLFRAIGVIKSSIKLD